MKKQNLKPRQICLLLFFGQFILLTGICQLYAQQPDQLDFNIHINQYEFDPLIEQPDFPETLQLGTDTLSDHRPMLIQFNRPLKREDMELLKRQYNLELNQYKSGQAYLEILDSKQISQLRQLDFLRWAGPYEPAYKLSPDIGRLVEGTPKEQKLKGIQLVAILVPNADRKRFTNFLKLSSAWQVKEVFPAPNSRFAFMWPKTKSLHLLATNKDVLHIYQVPEIEVQNNATVGTIQSGTPTNTPIWDKDLHGEGEIIHIFDTELDINHCFFSDPSNRPGINHRKVVAIRGQAVKFLGSHGTFVSGVIAGDDLNNPGKANNRGMAWASRISFSHLLYTEFLKNLHAAKKDGAFIHNNSFTINRNSKIIYDQMSFDLDQFTWNNEDHLVLGSSRNRKGPMGSPGTAKNAVNVGAAMADPNEMRYGSATPGPTPDGRRKPDLYAVGCGVTTAKPKTKCATELKDCGSSLATAATSGAAALVRQYYREGFYPTGEAMPSHGFIPSGALLKATLLNSTIDMTAIPGYPSNLEGWGLIRLDDALYFKGDDRNTMVWDLRHANGLTTGESHRYEVVVKSDTEPLKVTMVYTDAPGTAGSDKNVITNDLNLKVIAPDGKTSYLGNAFRGGESTAGGSPDRVNNVEMVFLKRPQPGKYVIEIEGKAVNVGKPGQGYAVVASGHFPEPPKPIGTQNTLVVKIREKGGAGPSQPLVTNKLSAVTAYINEVSYGKASIVPEYFPAGNKSIELDHDYKHYFQPNGNPLIEMTEELVAKMIALDPDVFNKGTVSSVDDIDRIMFVTNQDQKALEWSTTGQWPYNLPTGLTERLSVSVNSVNHHEAIFQHNVCNQLGIWNLHAHPGVVFNQPHVEGWDLMSKPQLKKQPVATGLTSWSKELAGWITAHKSEITFIPRPGAGANTKRTLGLNHVTDKKTNRKAIAIGLTEGVTKLADEKVYFFLEARNNGKGSVDQTLPESGVLLYYVNENIPQGQGTVRIIDTDLKDTDKSLALNNAALNPGDPKLTNINGTGLNVQVVAGTGTDDYDIILQYDPPEKDNDVRINVGDPSWTSPDVWVDNQADGYDDPDKASDKGNAPIIGEENRIYVRVRNPGPGDAFDFDVFVRVSEPYHTVGGSPDFNVFVDKKHFKLLKAKQTEVFYVTWKPKKDGDPHSCIQVDIPNVFNDVNKFNNTVQQNVEKISSTTESPFTVAKYNFGFTNPRNYQSLFYFRPDGIPADWNYTLSKRKVLLDPGERVEVALKLLPPDDAAICEDVTVDISSWEATGNTLIPIGGGTVNVNLRQRTNFSIQVSDSCIYRANTYQSTASGGNSQAPSGGIIQTQLPKASLCALVTRGCTNPNRPNAEITIKYVSPDGYPIYKKVQTDANGCFSDFFPATEGGQWEVSATYAGDNCAGPANSGSKRVNVPGPEKKDTDKDGLPDHLEPQNGNSNNPCLTNPDCDGDGVKDGKETPECRLDPDCSDRTRVIVGTSDKKLRYSAQLGSAHPLDQLDETSDANVHLQLGMHFPIQKNNWNQVDVLVGFHQFTRESGLNLDHPWWFNVSGGYTRKYLVGNSKGGYLRAAGGYYRNKVGNNTMGLQVGTGLIFPLALPNEIKLGLDYHYLLQDPNDRYFNISLGIEFD